MEIKIKTCDHCGETKNIGEFYLNKSWYSMICKNCTCKRNLLRRQTLSGCIGKIYNHQVRKSIKRKHNLPTYNKEEFLNWCLSNETFVRLHENWRLSNYSPDLVPSIDRLNDIMGYSFENIQVVTWGENNKLGHIRERNGETTRRCKSVLQYSLQGVFINEYYSLKTAEIATGVRNGNISHCCKGNYKSSGGYIWRYKD